MDPLEAFTHRRYTTGLASVAMFFVLSGFLICRSALGSGSVFRFLWHRFLRIFPGYWVCLVICACVFVPLMAFAEHGTLLRVFSLPRDSPQSFILHNAGLFHLNGFSISGVLISRQDSIGGLLTHNPVPRAINGSLWTLPYEVSCYLAVAVLTAVGVLRRARFIVLTSFALLCCLHFFDYVNPAGFWRCFPYTGMKDLVMLCLFFLAGCVGFLYREKIPHSTTVFVGCLITLGVSLPMGAFGLIAPIAMSYAFLWLAFILPFRRFDRKGDFSYGTYIYAFPVQQGLALLRIQDEGFGLYFTGSLLLTLVLAFLSYRLIEAPCLRWKAVKMPTFWRRARSPAAQLIEECPRPDAARAVP